MSSPSTMRCMLHVACTAGQRPYSGQESLLVLVHIPLRPRYLHRRRGLRRLRGRAPLAVSLCTLYLLPMLPCAHWAAQSTYVHVAPPRHRFGIRAHHACSHRRSGAHLWQAGATTTLAARTCTAPAHTSMDQPLQKRARKTHPPAADNCYEPKRNTKFHWNQSHRHTWLTTLRDTKPQQKKKIGHKHEPRSARRFHVQGSPGPPPLVPLTPTTSPLHRVPLGPSPRRHLAAALLPSGHGQEEPPPR